MHKLAIIKKVISKLHSNIKLSFGNKSLLTAFAKLTTGSALAQLVSIISIPILTRLYSVEAYGIQAVYNSVVAVVSTFIAGKYELAIVLPENKDDGLSLAYISIGIASVGCLAMYIMFYFFADLFVSLFSFESARGWLDYLPITIWVGTLYSVLYNFMNREKQYRIMVVSGVMVSVGNFLSALIYAIIRPDDAMGLLFATIFGNGIAAIWLLLIMGERKWIYYLSINKLKDNFLTYCDFPKYLILGGAVNSMSLQLPVFLLNEFADKEFVGIFAMVNRILGMPLRLIGNSVQNVYLKEGNEEYLHNWNCRKTYKDSFYILFFTSSMFLIFVFSLAPSVVPWVLGEKWYMAGMFCRYLCIVFFLQLIYSPLSCTSRIAGKQRIDMLFQFFRFFVILSIMLMGYSCWQTNVSLLVSYGVSMILIYGIGLYFSYTWSNGKKVWGVF